MTLLPVLNEPVCVAPEDTVRSVIVIVDVALDCATVKTYGVFNATVIVPGSLVVANQLQ